MAVSDDYLWDKSGEPDPTVVALEELLGPMGHDASTPMMTTTATTTHGATDERQRRKEARAQASRAYWKVLAAVFVLMVLGFAAYRFSLESVDKGGEKGPAPIAVSKQPPLRLGQKTAPVAEGETIVAGPGRPTALQVGSYGSVSLAAGTRVRVKRNSTERVLLELPKGSLDVRLKEVAPARFFQVDTPAGRVVDLGCEYTLDVDKAGGLELDMRSGWVAIEHSAGRVIVPAGATASSTKVAGPRIPVMNATEPPILDALKAYETSSEWGDQRAQATRLLNLLGQPHDTLIAWHLLGHVDDGVAGRAHQVLTRITNKPLAVKTADNARPTPTERDVWATHLYETVWTTSP